MNSFIAVLIEDGTKKIIKKVAVNAAIGGAADGAIALVDKKGFVKELGCGVVTAGVGTAATEAYRHFIKSTGPLGHAVGIVASIGARYTYRRVFEKQQPDEEEATIGTEK